jgi:hypothetical protein
VRLPSSLLGFAERLKQPEDDWTEWCRFFIEAVRVQAEDNLARTQAILSLYNDLKHKR